MSNRIDVDLLTDEALARYARARNAFTRRLEPLPRSKTIERGASHRVTSPDGEVSIDHAGCASRERPQLHSARKRGVYHRERTRRYLREYIGSTAFRVAA